MAAVTIRSLLLLGYPPSTPSLSSSQLPAAAASTAPASVAVSSDHTPVLPTSFDRANERLLLVLLHFLLSKLDPLFASSVSTCWPPYEVKDKNEFKRIVNTQMSKLTGSVLATGDFRSSLLAVAKGSAIWVLLKKLSDAALERAVRSAVLTYQALPDAALTTKQAAALFDSLQVNRADELAAAVQQTHAEVLQAGEAVLARRRRHAAYAGELDARLAAGTKTAAAARAAMQRLSASDDVRYLTEAARIERTELVTRIGEIQRAIRHLGTSPVFAECDKVIRFYCPGAGGGTAREAPSSSSSSSASSSSSSPVPEALFAAMRPLACDEILPAAEFLERYSDAAAARVAAEKEAQKERDRRASTVPGFEGDDEDEEGDEDEEEEEDDEAEAAAAAEEQRRREAEAVSAAAASGTLEDVVDKAEALLHTLQDLPPALTQLKDKIASSLEYL